MAPVYRIKGFSLQLLAILAGRCDGFKNKTIKNQLQNKLFGFLDFQFALDNYGAPYIELKS